MKKTIWLLLMMTLTTALHAAETRLAEPAFNSAESMLANPFGKSLEGEGVIVPKPGTLFSEGGNEEGLELPYLISQPKPIHYPRWAARQGWEGRFTLAIEILTDGTVGRYQVMQSTGHKLLDETAETAVRSWKFQPAIRNGKAVVTCIQVPVVFELARD